MSVELILGVCGWIAAAGAIGVWWGERTARIQAENFATYKTPHGKSKAVAVETEADPEEAARKKEWQQSVERVERGLRQDLEQQGRLGDVSDSRIREEAERMVGEAGGWRFDL